jgi:acetylornithine deacetylase/succinyl-diaminopimelate desuccinylase-like protein
MKHFAAALACPALALFVFCSNAPAQQPDSAYHQMAHDVFKQLIEINTTDTPAGNVTTAAEAMAQRFRDAGFPDADLHLLGPNDRKKNLVARLRGTGSKKPVLIIAHLDVVEAKRSDWTTDPFQFVEKDGYFYGRGTQDMKDSDAIAVVSLIRMKKEGFVPDRDIILALTADEEGGKSNGVDWLLKNHRDLVDAEFVLNPDSGGVDADNGKATAVNVEATEKLYADYQLLASDVGGHSSIPHGNNPIYRIADALGRLEKFQFPFELNPVTRAYFEKTAAVVPQQQGADMRAILKTPPDQAAITRLSTDPAYNSQTHTTCVATLISGGHAHNALPAASEANVNCRILPGHSPEEVRQQLIKVFADDKITVNYVSNAGAISHVAPTRVALPPPAPQPAVFDPLQKVAAKFWPGVPVIPDMENGASDSIYPMAAGIPSYGISGILINHDDVRAHGKDERLLETSYYRGADFYYQFLKEMTAPAAGK